MKANFLVKLGVLILTTLVSLKVVDLFVGPPPRPHPTPYAFSKNEGRSIVLREIQPNLDTIVEASPTAKSDRFDATPRVLQTDDRGFVVGSQKFQDAAWKPADIIFFGGSTTECLYVEPDVRFPAAVQRLLSHEDGEPSRVLNAGVSGSHSLHALISLLAKGIPEKPRVVVLMENINDLVTLTRSGSYWQAPPSRQILHEPRQKPDPGTKKIQRWLQATAHLAFHNLAERAILALPNLSSVIDPDREPIPPDDEWQASRNGELADQSRIAEDFRSSLLSFIRLSRSWNIVPVLMTQFNRFSPDDEFIKKSFLKSNQDYDGFCRRYAEFNEIIRKTAQEEDCLLIDLDRKIRPSKDYLYDGVHLNTEGCIFVAREIALALSTSIPGFRLVEGASRFPESDSRNIVSDPN